MGERGRSKAPASRRWESLRTKCRLGWELGREQQRILFLAEVKPSGDSSEASLFLYWSSVLEL